MPALQISDVVVYQPVPGSRAAVAYFGIRNHGSSAIRLSAVTSPQYAEVAMHETAIEDGVARMRPIESLVVDADSAISFEPGGKHLMLTQPRAALPVGAPVTLEFHFDSGELMIIDTALMSRTGS